MRNNGFRSAVNYLHLNSPDEITTQQIRTTQLGALVPLEGKIVYNTDTDKLLYYSNNAWRDLSVDLGNFSFSGNTIGVTNTNGSIILSPNGTGTVQLTKSLSLGGNNIMDVANVSTTAVTATYLTGQLLTAAQPNITSLGTLTSLSVGKLSMSSSTISASITNGSIVLSPDGTGVVMLTKTLNANSQNITNVGTLSTGVMSISTNDISVPVNTNISLTMSGTGMLYVGSHIILPSKDITGVTNLTAINLSTSSITTSSITATNISGTLTTASQPNITGVGTLTGLNVSNIKLVTNTISAVSGNLILSADGTGVVQLSKALNANSQNITNVGTITATSLAGTLTTAAQANVTSLGTLTALNVDSVNIDGSIINNTDTGAHLTLQSSSTLGVRINNFRTPFCQITSSVAYFTQNTNLNGLSFTASSSYSLFTLTSGTTLTVSETMNAFMMMTATMYDDASERYCALEFYENGVIVTTAVGGITLGEAFNNYTCTARGIMVTLTTGRSYTWRFSSINNGTANLTDLVVFITRV
jgi:hypothetical protein